MDEEFPYSFYYIGEMAESGEIPGGINLSFALECYTIAASYDNPAGFFKLAKLYEIRCMIYIVIRRVLLRIKILSWSIIIQKR